jgi:hypothetical protein
MAIESKEKLTILLAEYSALRAQLLQRNTIINQMFSISGTMLLALVTLGFTQSLWAGFLLLLVAPPILLFTFRLNESDMLVTAKRLEELQSEINDYAGEALLKSATAAGEPTLGYIPNFAYAVRPLDKLGPLFSRLWRHRTKLISPAD